MREFTPLTSLYAQRPAHPVRLLLAVSLMLMLVACYGPKSEIDQIRQRGELNVLTLNGPTTFYEGAHGLAGIEYELALGFAQSLGVELNMIPLPNLAAILLHLAEGRGDLAAAGITLTPQRQRWLRFTPPYQEIPLQLIYRQGKRRPVDLPSIDGVIEVAFNALHDERFSQLIREHPQPEWRKNRILDSEELLNLVWRGEIDYTIAAAHEVVLNQRYWPELRVAFNLDDPLRLAWAMPRFRDDSLYRAAVAWFSELQRSGALRQLIDRYYGHTERFDYVGNRLFRRHITERLPHYQKMFIEAAQQQQLDWRLLAAVSYQESHWNPRAISPTGVRGMMMLTQQTAAQLGVKRRTDARQSIEGGAAYLRQLYNRIDSSIGDPDRLWFALAAYNLGMGHLRDARKLTADRGGNPNRWSDLKETLPLLAKSEWYKQLQHGYARGHEALTYVENIRGYYDILIWWSHQQPAPSSVSETEVTLPPPAPLPPLPDGNRALTIDPATL
jgi:membrane-bound lytic murein transglycosylase F